MPSFAVEVIVISFLLRVTVRHLKVSFIIFTSSFKMAILTNGVRLLKASTIISGLSFAYVRLVTKVIIINK